MKKNIVISAANLFGGGTLSILEDCLSFLNKELADEYEITALVFNKKHFTHFNNIRIIEFPNIRRSYFHRIFYEYFYYKKLSEKLKPYLWISMNDMTSNVSVDRQVVYCHNPTPFKKLVFRDLIDQPKLFFFTIFYKYLYRINIHKNDYVIVQQQWLREGFAEMFKILPGKIVVAPPQIPVNEQLNNKTPKISKAFEFIFPTYPRPFKNIEVIGKAVEHLVKNGISKFKVTITLDGTENNYSKRIKAAYSKFEQMNFIGLISRDKVYELYSSAACLIFPSKLETWGLPISEFKQFDKPIILADLTYAIETLGTYDKGVFFNPDNHIELAEIMAKMINNKVKYTSYVSKPLAEPTVDNWKALFQLILK